MDHLEGEGIIVKVSHIYSQWATKVAPVTKGDGAFRLCGDCKVTINPALEVDRYPLPKPNDLFANLAGGEDFTKIDLMHACQLSSLEEKSREVVTINTHPGLFCYTRLPFWCYLSPCLVLKGHGHCPAGAT